MLKQQSYTVISISPNLIQIEVMDLNEFAADVDNKFSIGSYLKISDSHGSSVIAIVRSFRIKDPVPASATETTVTKMTFIVDTQPVGFIKDGEFRRGSQ